MTNDRPDLTPARRRAPSIAIAFRTLARTLRHGYDNLFTLLIVSVLWYTVALLILPLGVATAGMHRVVQPMTEERSANWRVFYGHLRSDLRWSSLLALIVVLGFLLIQINIAFYGASSSAIFQFFAILFGTFLIIWSGMALFAFPLALRQQEQSVLLSVLLVIFMLLPPLFMLIPGIVALWGAENARMLLVESGYLAKDEFADRERAKK
jgi:uncharacterized membrane protein YesL